VRPLGAEFEEALTLELQAFYRRFMAYIVERTRKPRGKNKKPETSYQVKWRRGGTAGGERESETFRDPKKAAHFKSAVELADGQYPPNFLPGGGDDGWVDSETYRRLIDSGADKPKVPTLAEYAATWVQSLSGIEGQSRQRYRRLLALHILPWFGEAAIDDTAAINPLTIGTWINELEAGTPAPADDVPRDELGPKSIRNVHGVLFAVLQSAVDAEPPLRATNPCRKTRLPKLEDGEGDEEMVFLTMPEFDTIVAVMKADAVALARLLVATGLRYSEATALQVRDLDLMAEAPRLSVRRAWKKQEDGTWDYGPPKTPRSRRNVALAASTVRLLLPLIVGKRPKDLVFVGPNGGRWVHQTFYTQRWRPAVYKAVRCERHRALDLAKGVGARGYRELTSEHIVPCGCAGVVEKVPRIHDLRHTHVAMLIATKAPLPAIQRRLGHESIKTTIDRYGHLMPELEGEMVAALDLYMNYGEPAVHPVGV